MSIANAAHCSMMGGKRKPYRRELEYIESTGTQRIDTGVVPSALTTWTTDAQFLTNADQIMGRAGDPALKPRFAFGRTSNASWYCGIGNINAWNGTFDTARHVFEINAPSKLFSVDASTYSIAYSSIGDTATIFLFARNYNNGDYFCNARIFRSTILNNGVLVRDFIPVLDWDGNAKMFDQVTQSYPAHYGTFTPGPEI